MSAKVESNLTLESEIADIYVQFYDDPSQVSNDELLFACLWDTWNAANYFAELTARAKKAPEDESIRENIATIETRLRKGTLSFQPTHKLAA